ncbi:MAG TPA: diaminopimelate epimerase, partial [Gemmatimonadales bacterium]|nr:diaminopimelate epimerase [Gemmatimonadales bacterium]
DGRVHRLDEWPVERIVAVCDRRTGVGADGFVLLEPEDPDTVRMHFYNADGSRAAMCGNAALCSTRLAARLGLAGSAMTLRTDAGLIPSRIVGEGTEAEICFGSLPLPAPVPAVALEAGEQHAFLGTVGVPHLVVVVDDVTTVDVARRGCVLRHHPAVGPEGANANFVSAPEARGEPWLIRTFERGVEGETLACGTGTVAAAVGLAAAGAGSLPMAFRSWGGFPLAVSGRLVASGAADVWLRGQGRLVFTAALAD